MRSAKVNRRTLETDITGSIELDSQAESSIQTGIAFLDHMLLLFSRHGGLT
ncbi:MAG: imidazoleglycerol-phosphate dehydratase, partial [Ruminococcaceae bacterium]|nr:imidazoleglycerol-phosphate dehydratase [Oscillospiraceae bacterium]